jgi:hypothetical protein
MFSEAAFGIGDPDSGVMDRQCGSCRCMPDPVIIPDDAAALAGIFIADLKPPRNGCDDPAGTFGSSTSLLPHPGVALVDPMRPALLVPSTRLSANAAETHDDGANAALISSGTFINPSTANLRNVAYKVLYRQAREHLWRIRQTESSRQSKLASAANESLSHADNAKLATALLGIVYDPCCPNVAPEGGDMQKLQAANPGAVFQVPSRINFAPAGSDDTDAAQHTSPTLAAAFMRPLSALATVEALAKARRTHDDAEVGWVVRPDGYIDVRSTLAQLNTFLHGPDIAADEVRAWTRMAVHLDTPVTSLSGCRNDAADITPRSQMPLRNYTYLNAPEAPAVAPTPPTTGPLVTQVHCAAVDLRHTQVNDPKVWEPLARPMVEAAYEAALYTAIIQAERSWRRATASSSSPPVVVPVFLSTVGGTSDDGGHTQWTIDAINRGFRSVVDVAIAAVSAARAAHSDEGQHSSSGCGMSGPGVGGEEEGCHQYQQEQHSVSRRCEAVASRLGALAVRANEMNDAAQQFLASGANVVTAMQQFVDKAAANVVVDCAVVATVVADGGTVDRQSGSTHGRQTSSSLPRVLLNAFFRSLFNAKLLLAVMVLLALYLSEGDPDGSTSTSSVYRAAEQQQAFAAHLRQLTISDRVMLLFGIVPPMAPAVARKDVEPTEIQSTTGKRVPPFSTGRPHIVNALVKFVKDKDADGTVLSMLASPETRTATRKGLVRVEIATRRVLGDAWMWISDAGATVPSLISAKAEAVALSARNSPFVAVMVFCALSTYLWSLIVFSESFAAAPDQTAVVAEEAEADALAEETSSASAMATAVVPSSSARRIPMDLSRVLDGLAVGIQPLAAWPLQLQVLQHYLADVARDARAKEGTQADRPSVSGAGAFMGGNNSGGASSPDFTGGSRSGSGMRSRGITTPQLIPYRPLAVPSRDGARPKWRCLFVLDVRIVHSTSPADPVFSECVLPDVVSI